MSMTKRNRERTGSSLQKGRSVKGRKFETGGARREFKRMMEWKLLPSLLGSWRERAEGKGSGGVLRSSVE